jgi:hypothetical protein
MHPESAAAPANEPVHGAAWPAWPLPFIAGALPFAATLMAYTLSVRLGLIEPCNPFLDGCTSISRAARHALPNHLFRALLLPAAVLQGLSWLLCVAWLRGLGAAPTRKLRALPWLGLAAALFLVLYGTFLGTEGTAYRWMRRYGVVVYFGATCIAMLIASDAAHAVVTRARGIARLLQALCVALPLLGLANALAPVFDARVDTIDALQNSTEWWAGLVFTLFFVLLACLWRVDRFEVRAARAFPPKEDHDP